MDQLFCCRLLSVVVSHSLAVLLTRHTMIKSNLVDHLGVMTVDQVIFIQTKRDVRQQMSASRLKRRREGESRHQARQRRQTTQTSPLPFSAQSLGMQVRQTGLVIT